MSIQITILILIVATIPFVASILSALSPKTRVKDIGDYFLYDSKLDIDSFIKTTIGYSLQVASIYLFFFWTLTYGLLAPLTVCCSWAIGYYLIAWMLRTGKLDSLLNLNKDDDSYKTRTIHGLIGTAVSTRSNTLRSWIICAASMASIIGIGGTMMTEIDYATGYITSSISSANNIPEIGSLAKSLISLSILLFTALYVLWGGYRSVVFTDRFQTPIAYGAFALFSFIVAIYGLESENSSNVAITLGIIILIYTIIGLKRWFLINKFPNDKQLSSNRLSTFLTFSPIIFTGIILLVNNLKAFADFSLFNYFNVIFFSTENFLGFGIWGLIALALVNAVWQLIDISSLQRLQSLDMSSVDTPKHSEVERTLKNIGIEAGLGWLIICFVAILLKTSGFSADFIEEMIRLNSGLLAFAVIIFIFTCVVYMLSTISGLISALSYISFYDIVPVITRRQVIEQKIDTINLNPARLTTIVSLLFVSVLYVTLKAAVDNNEIAYILYAIYAFQIVILPSAVLSITGLLKPVTPYAVLCSILVGILVAYWTAKSPSSWELFASIGMTEEGWAVIPPFLSGVASIVCYFLINFIEKSVARTNNILNIKD